MRIAKGYSDAALHMALGAWASRLDSPPSATQISERFGVHYNTACKLRSDWLDVRDPTKPLHRLAATGSVTTPPTGATP